MRQDDRNSALHTLLNQALRPGGMDDLLKTWLWEFTTQVLKKFTRDTNELDRVVSDIYEHKLRQVRLWVALQKQASTGDAVGYLARTIINAFRDIKRKEQRQSQREILVSPEDYLLQEDVVLAAALAEEPDLAAQFQALERCLKNVDEEDLLLIHLRYGFFAPPASHLEIAEKTGIHLETVKKRLQRLLPKLKKCFEEPRS